MALPSYTLSNDKNEKHIEYGELPPEPLELHRAMSSRQVQMIAVAGTIGTGLFLGTGTALAKGGPGSILLAYSLGGCIVYATMLALGEMATFLPTTGSFTDYACRFVGKPFGFSLSWIYWLQNAITLAADLTAAQVLLEFWTKHSYPDFPTVVISIVFLIILMALNGIHVKGYAEGEYWLSILKVLTIIVFIITGVVVSAGANTNGHPIGFKYWTTGDAPFANGVGGFAMVFITSAFAYSGTESISITAGETKNPRRNMPRIIRNVFYRILIFYILALFIITINIPYNMKGLAGNKEVTMSPFTMVFEKAGIDAAAHVVNAVILSSALSAGNHALFSGTRILFALAKRGQAPQIFARVNRKGVPVFSVIATGLISVICFSVSFIGSREMFECLLVMVGVSTQIAWISIAYTSLCFRKALSAQNQSIQDLPFINRIFPYGNYAVIFTVSGLIVAQGCVTFYDEKAGEWQWNAIKFISFFLLFPILAGLLIGYKYLMRPTPLIYTKMDLDTGRYFDTAEDQAENEKEEAERFGAKYYFKKIFFFLF